MQVIDALWFVTVFAFSALVILAATDWRLGAPLALWICGYVGDARLFRAARAQALGRARAQARDADRAASSTATPTSRRSSCSRISNARTSTRARRIVEHNDAFHRQTRTITWLNLTVSSSNSALLTIIAALCVLLWRAGAVSLGDVAVAIGLALRVVTMSGWVMWTAIGIFDNVGQVQEGMRTIARPRALVDRARRPRARRLARARSPSSACASTTASRAA